MNSEFDPPYPLPTSPGAAPVSDDDDSSVDSAGDPIPDLLSPEGAISDSESDDEDDDLLAPEGAKAPNPPTPPHPTNLTEVSAYGIYMSSSITKMPE